MKKVYVIVDRFIGVSVYRELSVLCRDKHLTDYYKTIMVALRKTGEWHNKVYFICHPEIQKNELRGCANLKPFHVAVSAVTHQLSEEMRRD
jgi:hypothetical protein